MSVGKTNRTINLVNGFIASWIGGEIGHIQTEFTESNVVKTLIYENKWYAWNVHNDFAIILMSFNDLDYTFNCTVSFNTEDPNNEEEFFKKEIEEVTFEEMCDFIKETWYSVKDNFKEED